MNNLIQYLIQANYASFIVIIFMLVFLSTNHFFDKKVINHFIIAMLSLLVIVIVDSIEYWTSSFTYPTILRIWVSAIGYSLRPAVIFLMILIIELNKKINRFLLAIPLFINIIVSFSALFCDIAFSYSTTNKFVRGSLGYTPFFVSIFYFLALVIITFKAYTNKNSMEPMIAIAVALLNIFSMCYESNTNQDGIINTTGAISIVFYYLYLNTQNFKRDPLTNVFNRRCFFIDAERNESSLTAVISIDLNNLKQINDNESHEAGDKAICEMVKCIQNSLVKGCFLYRVGGDEFMILCFRKKKEEVLHISEKIQYEMKKTPYQCAIGTAFLENNINFKNACTIADEEMYKNKRKQKKSVTE